MTRGTLDGTHTYAHDGRYSVAITVTDDDSATQKGALEAKDDVSDAALAAAFGGRTQKPTRRKP